MIKNISKALGAFAMLLFAMMCLFALMPDAAFALGWDPTQMAQSAAGEAGTTITTIDQQTVANWVTSMTNFLLGIAIVIFVMKIVLTAICNMMGDDSTITSTLQGLPIIGAYKMERDETFKDIFLKKFMKNFAIIVGAWILVQLVVGLVLWLFTTFTTTS